MPVFISYCEDNNQPDGHEGFVDACAEYLRRAVSTQLTRPGRGSSDASEALVRWSNWGLRGFVEWTDESVFDGITAPLVVFASAEYFDSDSCHEEWLDHQVRVAQEIAKFGTRLDASPTFVIPLDNSCVVGAAEVHSPWVSGMAEHIFGGSAPVRANYERFVGGLTGECRTELDALAADIVTYLTAPQPSLTVPTNVTPKPDRYVDRDTISSQLAWFASSGARQDGIAVLCGPGGFGKTLVVQAFAHDFARQFSRGTWLVDATGVTDVWKALSLLADELGTWPPEPELGPAQGHQVWQQLQDRGMPVDADWVEPGPNTLLVFDNVTEPELLEHVWEELGLQDASWLTVVATTRCHPSQLGAEAMCMPVGSMSVAQGSQLLRSYLPDRLFDADNTAEHAESVVLLLDGFPLALEQVGVYVRNHLGCNTESFGTVSSRLEDSGLVRDEAVVDHLGSEQQVARQVRGLVRATLSCTLDSLHDSTAALMRLVDPDAAPDDVDWDDELDVAAETGWWTDGVLCPDGFGMASESGDDAGDDPAVGPVTGSHSVSFALPEHLPEFDEEDPVAVAESDVAACRSFVVTFPDNPEYVQRLGAALARLGKLLEDTDPARAVAVHMESLQACRRLVSLSPRDDDYLHGMAVALTNIGRCEAGSAPDDAVRHFEHARTVLGGLVAQDPADDGFRRDYAVACAGLARCLEHREPDRAAVHFAESLESCRILVRGEAPALEDQRSLAAVLSSVSRSVHRTDAAEAVRLSAEAVDVCEQLVHRHSDESCRRDLGVALVRHGHLVQPTDSQGALRFYQRAVAACRALTECEPESTQYQRDLGIALTYVARILQDSDPESALELYRESLDIHRGLAKAREGNAEHQRDMGVVLADVARLTEPSSPSEARTYYEEALELHERLAAQDPDNLQYQRDVAGAALHAGRAVTSRSPRLSTVRFEQSVAAYRRVHRKDPQDALAAWGLGIALVDVASSALPGDARVVPWFEEARTVCERLVAHYPGHPGYQRGLAVALSTYGMHSACSDPVAVLTEAARLWFGIVAADVGTEDLPVTAEEFTQFVTDPAAGPVALVRAVRRFSHERPTDAARYLAETTHHAHRAARHVGDVAPQTDGDEASSGSWARRLRRKLR